MNQIKLCFIGAGNMARSIIGGLIADGYPRENLCATDPNAAHCQQFSQTMGVNCESDNVQAAQEADVIILCVKPQQIAQVCQELADTVQTRHPLVISVAAGIRTQDLSQWLGGKVSLVRAMPNTPALIRSGATALFANEQVSEAQRTQAENILRSTGLVVWVKTEQQIDAVTALSGSGPAYYFLFMEAMEQAGVDLGLEPQTAHLLTLQTALGAAKMAIESTDDCATLRRKVTSPGGTTEQALKVFEEKGCRSLVEQAMQAAYQRSLSLAEELGNPLNALQDKKGVEK
ncbi:pyrroline-5-carboxylate reductase [Galenea microaerophila]